MKKLTVSEYSKIYNIPESTVRYKIRNKQLAVTRETLNNRKTTFILVDNHEETTVNITTNLQQEKQSVIADVAAGLQQDAISLNDTFSAETNVEIISLLKQMYNDNKNLALEAGQVKLLETSESSTKQLYFELQQENKMLLQKTSAQEKEIELLQNQIKELEKKNQAFTEEITKLKEKKSFWQNLNESKKL